ncbi:hypothetical protein [Shouchella shacheensis]|uniref:hypothetical protein n=1 Tax=Shouchella shacheensis TaxID=1649580 RepID=UPI000AFABEB1|nr:hypothetical protein [Shouchella shacheensis]
MRKEQKEQHTEGRDDYFMDVERMIDEGLNGGTVHPHEGGKIETARPLEKEDPPHHS